VYPSDIAARRSHRFTFVSYLDLTGIVYNMTTMTRRFIDLSIYLENDVITDPPFMRPTGIRVTGKDAWSWDAPFSHTAQPPHGYTVACFPHKVRSASAGWTRAVAIFEDEGVLR
jgi:hypothetical protein